MPNATTRYVNSTIIQIQRESQQTQQDKITGINSKASNLRFLEGTNAERAAQALKASQDANESIVRLERTRIEELTTLQNAVLKNLSDCMLKASGKNSPEVTESLNATIKLLSDQVKEILDPATSSIVGGSNEKVNNDLKLFDNAVVTARMTGLQAIGDVDAAAIATSSATVLQAQTALNGHAMWAVNLASSYAASYAKSQGATDAQVVTVAKAAATAIITRSLAAVNVVGVTNQATAEAAIDAVLTGANIGTDVASALTGLAGATLSGTAANAAATAAAAVATLNLTAATADTNQQIANVKNQAYADTNTPVATALNTVTNTVAGATTLTATQAGNTGATSFHVNRAAVMVAAYVNSYGQANGGSTADIAPAIQNALNSFMNKVISKVAATPDINVPATLQASLADGSWVKDAVGEGLDQLFTTLKLNNKTSLVNSAVTAVGGQLGVTTKTSAAAYNTNAHTARVEILKAASLAAGTSEQYVLDTAGKSVLPIKYMGLDVSMLTPAMTDTTTSTTAAEGYRSLQNLIELVDNKMGECRAIQSAIETRIEAVINAIKNQDSIYNETLALGEEEARAALDEEYNALLKAYNILAEQSKIRDIQARYLNAR